MKIFACSCLLLLLCVAPKTEAAEAFNTAAVRSSGQFVVPTRVLPTNRPSAEQRALYEFKVGRIRRHHLSLPAPIAAVPFAATLSANRQIIKPKAEAALSDGIDVSGKVAATTLAKMDYGYVSPVAEPSVAMVRQNVLVTFNWGAVWSSDGGKTFAQLDPFALFDSPKAALGTGFCCDQVAIYSDTHDLLIWLLQGSHDDKGNTIRLLIAKGADIEARKFQVHDFSPQSLGAWTGEWFDFPDIAISEKHLFVSFNTFLSNGSGYTRSAVIRFPLSQLAAYQDAQASVFSSDGVEDFTPRFAQGSGKRMYWGTHRDTASLVVRSWGDDVAQPDKRRVVSVEAYARPDADSVKSAVSKNKKPWLKRLDERITAGWAAQGTVGFAWSSGSIAGGPGVARYPYPHVRVAIVNQADLDSDGASFIQPVAQPHIWSSRFAIVYPAASPNKAGDIGIGAYFGGPNNFPSSAIGVLQRQGTEWRTVMTVLSMGKNTPRCLQTTGTDDNCGTWGDYMTIRPHPERTSAWVTVGHTAEDLGKKEQPKIVATFSPFSVKKP